MAKHNGPPRRPGNPNKPRMKPWQPTERQMKWYVDWTQNNKGPSQIAAESVHKVSRQTVCEAVHKVQDWIRDQDHDRIMRYRDRFVAQHLHMMKEMGEAWQKSKGEVTAVTCVVGGDNPTTTTKITTSYGDTCYSAEYRAYAKAVRDMLGIDEVVKTEVTVSNANEIEGLPGMNGFKNRAEFLLATAEALKARAMASQ